MVNVPKSSGGPGPSRSIVLLLAAGLLSLAGAGIELAGFDLPWIDAPLETARYGFELLVAAYAVRHVGGRR